MLYGKIKKVLFLGGKRHFSFKALQYIAGKMNVVASVFEGDDIPDYFEKFCKSKNIPVYT